MVFSFLGCVIVVNCSIEFMMTIVLTIGQMRQRWRHFYVGQSYDMTAITRPEPDDRLTIGAGHGGHGVNEDEEDDGLVGCNDWENVPQPMTAWKPKHAPQAAYEPVA